MKQQVIEEFQQEYGRSPQAVARAPGRLEILGNHTDYNEGVVLSVAVDRETFVAADITTGGKTCRMKDLADGSSRTFELDQLDNPEAGDWANYIKGVVVELQQRGIVVPAFDAVILSSVPMSAGMSSSAALEIATALALGQLAGVSLPWLEWARIGQGAENNYVGAKTGLMDQFSSIKGRQGQLVFSDFRTLEVRNVPLPPGTALVVANSMVKHTLTGEYNERRERCEEAVAVLQKSFNDIVALRDVTREQLEGCRDGMDPVTYRRALHVVGENERVFSGVAALQDNDLAVFGRLMFESQESSRVNFENSCSELDLLVEIGKSLPGAIGARLSGGGFGGISVHLVYEAEAENYSRLLASEYEKRTGLKTEVMICQAAEGAGVYTDAGTKIMN